jgi:hypothetical protein
MGFLPMALLEFHSNSRRLFRSLQSGDYFNQSHDVGRIEEACRDYFVSSFGDSCDLSYGKGMMY